MPDEPTRETEPAITRRAATLGREQYGTAGAVVAGAAAGALVGYRIATRGRRTESVRSTPDSNPDPDPDPTPDRREPGVYELAGAALDAATALTGGEPERPAGSGGAGAGTRDPADHVRPGEGVDVPVDGGEGSESDGEGADDGVDDDG